MTLLDDETLDLDRFRVHSRREITNLLRNVAQRNQLLRMSANIGADSVTAILDVDDDAGMVIVDCATTASITQCLLDSENIRFETKLDNIRIIFSVPHVELCEYENRPALRIELPLHVVRMQRREHYRVFTPVAKPVYCTIHVAREGGDGHTAVVGSLYNISGGGIAINDEKKQIPAKIGTTYENCEIDIPGSPVAVALQLSNSQEVSLSNGKQIRRLGLMFVHPSNATLAAIQRYITKLEREQNARQMGMA